MNSLVILPYNPHAAAEFTCAVNPMWLIGGEVSESRRKSPWTVFMDIVTAKIIPAVVEWPESVSIQRSRPDSVHRYGVRIVADWEIKAWATVKMPGYGMSQLDAINVRQAYPLTAIGWEEHFELEKHKYILHVELCLHLADEWENWDLYKESIGKDGCDCCRKSV